MLKPRRAWHEKIQQNEKNTQKLKMTQKNEINKSKDYAAKSEEENQSEGIIKQNTEQDVPKDKILCQSQWLS